jgi:anti-anti-sigma factor
VQLLQNNKEDTMTVKVEVSSNGKALQAEVRGSFDFEASRSLLALCRPAFGPALQSVTIELVGVHLVRSCALGALLVLSEHAGRVGIALRLKDCAENIAYLFSSGMFSRHFTIEQARECAGCVESGCRKTDCRQGHPEPDTAHETTDYRHCGQCVQPGWVACFNNCGQSQFASAELAART